jgi:hypothetical protein
MDKHREMMIDTMSFPGVFFCLCRRLEAVFRAAIGISLPAPQNAPEMPLKRLVRLP